MCGIAGLFRFDQQPIEQVLLKRMAQMQQHRGPDDEGFFVDGCVGFAFRRLAILDLSPAGHQPMSGADGTCWLVFNGEIYNHNELRRELQQYGHHFRSRTDTEVILAAYAQWGVDCLSRLNGMWAFALWDSRQQQLFCARDRFGIKPFYYHQDANRLIFASEIKALFVDPQTPRQPNERAVYTYLVFQETQFGEETFFANVKQLPAAHYMLVDAQGTRIKRYWQLDHNRYDPTITDAEAIESFRHLFFDSVRLRLQSDVPVGTCLSGGLDSSAIVCVANHILFGNEKKPDRTVVGERQKTFSACYNDPRCDERQWISPVIAKTSAQPHYIYPDAEGLFTDLEKMLWYQEEPVGGTSIYAQWCVMHRAREAGVVVMLDGQGGDEVMGGYQRYYWSLVAGGLRSGNLALLQQALTERPGSIERWRLIDLLGVLLNTLPVSWQYRVLYAQRGLPVWLGEQMRSHSYVPESTNSCHPTWLGQELERDLIATSLPALLKYEERNSMAHSIEARVPFLDYRLVEFMASLPDSMKIRNGRMKWLLREGLKDVMPIEITQRRNKIGFGTPEDDWLSKYWAQIQDYLCQGEVLKRGWLNQQAVESVLQSPVTVAQSKPHLIWRWLNTEVWLKSISDRF
jgi:asparagine synthase (glutamine-hydrolysing)